MHNIGLLDFETMLLFFQNWNEDDPIKSNAHVFFSFFRILVNVRTFSYSAEAYVKLVFKTSIRLSRWNNLVWNNRRSTDISLPVGCSMC